MMRDEYTNQITEAYMLSNYNDKDIVTQFL